MTIRYIQHEEWNDCMALCWRTFLAFEADDYTPEGVKNFFDFVTSTQVEDMFLNGNYKAAAAFENDEPIGFIGVRNTNHISLLFVDAKHHHKGVGTGLVKFIAEELCKIGRREATVYSSPYAVGFYHAIGFMDIDKVQNRDGIIYTPMILSF